MRREGYELQVGQPRVIVKEIDGVKCEPMEYLTIDTPEAASGRIIELVTKRKGDMLVMEPKGDLMHIEFEIPSRGIIGLRTDVLNVSAGEAIMAHRFKAYEPWKGPIPGRLNGSIISGEGRCHVCLFHRQTAGSRIVLHRSGDEVYEGQIIGQRHA